MTISKKALLAASASLLLAPAAAFAAPTIGDMLGTSAQEVRANLTSAGYDVRDIEIEDDELEAVVLADGQLLELEISPTTGMITSIEIEDDDDDHAMGN